MQIALYIDDAKYILTTKNSASNYGLPVLISANGITYGPNDLLPGKTAPAGHLASWALQADYEARQWANMTPTEDQVQMVERFDRAVRMA